MAALYRSLAELLRKADAGLSDKLKVVTKSGSARSQMDVHNTLKHQQPPLANAILKQAGLPKSF
jgi:hypothetical protein